MTSPEADHGPLALFGDGPAYGLQSLEREVPTASQRYSAVPTIEADVNGPAVNLNKFNRINPDRKVHSRSLQAGERHTNAQRNLTLTGLVNAA